MPQLRLSTAGEYSKDIRAIRSAVRANGTRFHCKQNDPIVVTHPQVQSPVNIYINYGYQANSAEAAVNASLYVVAFGNANGTSRFTMNPAPGAGWPFGAAGGLNVVPEDGSYGSLGNALGPFAQIMPGGLQNSVQTMSTFGHGGALGANERAALINLIIISSEAVRFTDVEDDVTHIIKGQSRTPSWANIHAWGGNTLPT